MYVVMMYVCANHCFALIDHIPEKALSWMGAQAQAMAHVGDESKIASTEMLGEAYVGQQLVSTLTGPQGAANQAGDGLKALLGKTRSPLGRRRGVGGEYRRAEQACVHTDPSYSKEIALPIDVSGVPIGEH